MANQPVPQPPAAPNVPPQPPVAPQQPIGYAPQKPKTGLIVGLIVGFVVLAAGVAVLLIFLLNSGPSREDYSKAQVSAKSIATSYRSLSSDLSSYTRSIAYGSSVTTGDAKETLAKYKEQVAELKDEKAFKDEEAKKLYDAFASKNEEFVKFLETFIASESAITDTSKNCASSKASGLYSVSDYSTISTRYNELLGPCITSLKELAGSDNATLAEYAEKIQKLYEEQKALFADLQAAYIAKDSTKLRSVASEISTQGRKFSSTSSSSITDKVKDLEVSDELNALGTYLTDKANGKE